MITLNRRRSISQPTRGAGRRSPSLRDAAALLAQAGHVHARGNPLTIATSVGRVLRRWVGFAAPPTASPSSRSRASTPISGATSRLARRHEDLSSFAASCGLHSDARTLTCDRLHRAGLGRTSRSLYGLLQGTPWRAIIVTFWRERQTKVAHAPHSAGAASMCRISSSPSVPQAGAPRCSAPPEGRPPRADWSRSRG